MICGRMSDPHWRAVLPYLATLCFAGLIYAAAAHAQRVRLKRAANEGVVAGTVVSVSPKRGWAFGERSRWYEVVVRYTDDSGAQQIITQDAPGTGWWKPKVGATVHLFRRHLVPGRVVRNRLGAEAGEVIVECEAHVERFMFVLSYALIASTLVWAAADWAL